jgi:hypothetical protein
MTPLHLAVRTSEEILTTRPIRALLIKGANPRIRDFNGNLPEDHLKDFDMEVPMMYEYSKEIYDILQDEEENLNFI